MTKYFILCGDCEKEFAVPLLLESLNNTLKCPICGCCAQIDEGKELELLKEKKAKKEKRKRFFKTFATIIGVVIFGIIGFLLCFFYLESQTNIINPTHPVGVIVGGFIVCFYATIAGIISMLVGIIPTISIIEKFINRNKRTGCDKDKFKTY